MGFEEQLERYRKQPDAKTTVTPLAAPSKAAKLPSPRLPQGGGSGMAFKAFVVCLALLVAGVLLVFGVAAYFFIAAAEPVVPTAGPALVRRVPRGPMSAEQVFETAAPSVVVISCFDYRGTMIATGSGFFLQPGKVIITNAHVVKGAASLEIKTFDGRMLTITETLVVDDARDLAVLPVTESFLSPPGLWLSETEPKTGAPVFAIGAPEGFEFTISGGLVSQLREKKVGHFRMIQTSASISHGSSGGPLLNVNGDVVGVTTSGLNEAQNVNFAMSYIEVAAVQLASQTGADARPLVEPPPAPPSAAIKPPPVATRVQPPTPWVEKQPTPARAPVYDYEPPPPPPRREIRETEPALPELPARKPIDLVEVSLNEGKTMVGAYIRSERDAVIVAVNGEEMRVPNSNVKRLRFLDGTQPKNSTPAPDHIIDLEPQKDIPKQTPPPLPGPPPPPPQVVRVDLYDGTALTGIYRRVDRFSFVLVVDGVEQIIADADVRRLAVVELNGEGK